MEIKKHSTIKITICAYIICSILGAISIITSREIAMLFFSFGASSGYIALGVFAGDYTISSGVLLFLSMLWTILFPVVMLIAFVLALKGKYRLICTFVFIDTLIVMCWVVYAYINGNSYGANLFVLDLIVSVIFTSWLLYSTAGQGGTGDKGDKGTVLLSPQKNS